MVGYYTGVYYSDDSVGGLPLSTWIEVGGHVYLNGGLGVQFCGWPDGEPLQEQEYLTVWMMATILDERLKNSG